MTNLEQALMYFPKAIFDENDNYQLDNTFEIEWLGDGENFVVNENRYCHDIGYYSNPEIFAGNFGQCLHFVLELTGRMD